MEINKKLRFNNFPINDKLNFQKLEKTKMFSGTNIKPSIKKISYNKKPKIKLGEIFSLKINALGPKKMGLVELNNGLTVFVPNANLGDLVKIKLEKILPLKKSSGKTQNLKTIILAKLIQVVQKKSSILALCSDLEIGKPIRLTIKAKGPKNSGIGKYSDFTIIVPNSKIGETIDVKITKIKANYAFGLRSLNEPLSSSDIKNNLTINSSVKLETMFEKTKAFLSNIETSSYSKFYHLILPKNALINRNFFIFKLNYNYIMVKKNLGIEVGDHILIKLLRVREKFSIAKVIKVLQKNPVDQVLVFNTLKKNISIIEKYQKVALNNEQQNKKMKTILKKMILSSMHYGEKAIKCNANMRSYIWLRKKGKNKNKPLLKRGRHIINLFKTYKSLKKALLQISKYAANGQTFLFVGTKKSASSLIARTAILSKTSFFVNSRWLGGMLTNWKTILKSISQIKPILKEKQKVIELLLASRQRIKDRLLTKVNMLRKKSKKFMLKGKKLIVELQKNPDYFIQKNQRIVNLSKTITNQNKNYIEKYSIISLKEQSLITMMNSLKSTLSGLLDQKKYLKHQILNTKKELSDFKQLFLIGQELSKLKNSILSSNKKVLSISFEKLSDDFLMIPNPSINILNQIISVYYKKLNLNSAEYQKNQSKSEISNKPIILSKLLDKFLIYLPFMKKYLLLSYNRLNSNILVLKQLNNSIEIVIQKLKYFYNKALVYKKVLEILKSKLLIQQKLLKVLKMKLKTLSSEQRLLKFLPKLRYLPTTKTKMYTLVELLMKKFVDPKMSYVIDQIYDQKLKLVSKKMAAARKQKWQRLEKYFGGVTQMAKISKNQIFNNVAIIIGQQEEMNAVRECQKLGMKIFTIVDTNCNPKLSDNIIPANDDSGSSVEYILGQILTYIRLAQNLKRKISTAYK